MSVENGGYEPPPPPPESAFPPPPPPPEPDSQPRRRHVKWLATAGTLVTVAVVAVTVFATLNSRESSPETLALETPSAGGAQSEPVEPEEDPEEEAEEDLPPMEAFGQYTARLDGLNSADWRIPVSAPIETFPLGVEVDESGMARSCTAAQVEWLNQWATPAGAMMSGDISARFGGELWNNSDSGAAVSLGNIRFEGAEEPAEPVVLFRCPQCCMGDGLTQAIEVGVDGSPAVFTEGIPVYTEDEVPAGTPATLNLQPGELLTLDIFRAPSVDTTRLYKGRLVADVLDGTGKQVAILPEMTFWPAPAGAVGYLNDSSSTFECRIDGAITPCTLAEAKQLMSNLASSARR